MKQKIYVYIKLVPASRHNLYQQQIMKDPSLVGLLTNTYIDTPKIIYQKSKFYLIDLELSQEKNLYPSLINTIHQWSAKSTLKNDRTPCACLCTSHPQKKKTLIILLKNLKLEEEITGRIYINHTTHTLFLYILARRLRTQ